MQQAGAGTPPTPYTPQGSQPPHAAQANEPGATTALVLGILGVVICQILAPFAWNAGKKSLANISANPGVYAGEGMAKAGYILGIIGTVLLIVGLVFLVLWFVFLAALFAAA